MKKIFIALAFIFAVMLSALSISAQTQSREELIKEIKAKRAELVRLEKHIPLPSEEDRAAYADFLAPPNTGLIRLLPREKYDPKVKNANKEQAHD